MYKKIISIVMILSLVLSLFVTVSANDDITIYVNEQKLQCDAAPFIENGRTMVPMRRIFEALDAEVNWEGETKTITAVKENKIVTLQIDNYSIFKNGEKESIDVAPVIVNNSTFVPIRAVSQSMEASVEWLDKTRSVYINSPKKYNYDMNTEKYVIMYAPDGREIEIKQSEINAYVDVGWYTEPVTTMYSTDGREICVFVSEVDAYVNVGWYRNPVIIMYSTDGRTIVVSEDEEDAYRNVGWYGSYDEAEAAYESQTKEASKRNDIRSIINIGWELYNSGCYQEALEMCESAKKIPGINITELREINNIIDQIYEKKDAKKKLAIDIVRKIDRFSTYEEGKYNIYYWVKDTSSSYYVLVSGEDIYADGCLIYEVDKIENIVDIIYEGSWDSWEDDLEWLFYEPWDKEEDLR